MNLEQFGDVLADVDLTNYNTYKIKSSCTYLVKPNNVDSLVGLIKYLKENNKKYFVLGNGSNVILPSSKYDGVIIKLDNLDEIKIEGIEVAVGAGVLLNKFAMFTIDNNLKGLEWATGIPGTIGGAIVGNAGAYKSEIFDYVKEVYVLDKNLDYQVLSADEVNHSYRYTMFKDDKSYIVLGAKLSLNEGIRASSMELVQDRLNRRMSSQPLEFPSAGSVFRNPDEATPAGRLIEEAGLKGSNIDGAYVAEKHANFIINKENATSDDIIKLITKIKDEVKEKNNIDLTLEQEIVKW